MGKYPVNYSTRIKAKRTAAECVELLAEAGADAVAVQYADRQPVGLSFQLDTPRGPCHFGMPVNIDGAQAMLRKVDFSDVHRSTAERLRMHTRDHAANVAWRVVRDWLEAQLAIIAAGMTGIDQVMLPYLQVGPGETLYDRFAAGPLELEGPRSG